MSTVYSQSDPFVAIADRFPVQKVFADGGSSAKTMLVLDHGTPVVLKCAAWDGIGSSGAPWLRAQSARLKELKANLPTRAARAIPEVYDTYDDGRLSYYTLEYFPDSVPLSVYYYGHPGEARSSYLSEIDHLMTFMATNLYTAGRLPVPEDYVERVHLRKIAYRLSHLTRTEGDFYERFLRHSQLGSLFERLTAEPRIHINGVPYANAPRLLAAVREAPALITALTPTFLPLLAHGDGTLRNYLKLREGGFALIDVRGTNLPDNAPSRICIPYELGKVLRTFYLEIIRQNAYEVYYKMTSDFLSFTLNFDLTHASTAAFLEVRSTLLEALPLNEALRHVLTDEPEWLEKALFAEACHFLADASNRLESDPAGNQAIAYYLIGTMLLSDYLSRRGIVAP